MAFQSVRATASGRAATGLTAPISQADPALCEAGAPSVTASSSQAFRNPALTFAERRLTAALAIC
jgi:hypothetical protein